MDLSTPPPFEPDGTAVVYGASALGGGWLASYEHWALEDGVTRVRLRPDRLHPRLVLPFALLHWSTGGPATIGRAACEVSRWDVERCLELVEQVLVLPLPCPGGGRCPVTVTGGRLQPALGTDPGEAVATALLHRGPCRWSRPARTVVPDQAGRFRRGWGDYQQLRRGGGRSTCPTCRQHVHPAGARCGNCGVYPYGPDARCTRLDRFEMALGVLHPARG